MPFTKVGAMKPDAKELPVSKRVIGSPVDLALTAKVARGETLTPAELELWLGAPPETVFRKILSFGGRRMAPPATRS